MKLPPVVVGPHAYTVVTADTLPDDLLGDTDPVTLTIRLRDGMPETVAAEVLLHEVLHAAWDLTAVRCLPDDVEESIVTSLAPLLLDVLRRNPKLLAVLVP